MQAVVDFFRRRDHAEGASGRPMGVEYKVYGRDHAQGASGGPMSIRYEVEIINILKEDKVVGSKYIRRYRAQGTSGGPITMKYKGV